MDSFPETTVDPEIFLQLRETEPNSLSEAGNNFCQPLVLTESPAS